MFFSGCAGGNRQIEGRGGDGGREWGQGKDEEEDREGGVSGKSTLKLQEEQEEREGRRKVNYQGGQ
jgi:hypothetical protein